MYGGLVRTKAQYFRGATQVDLDGPLKSLEKAVTLNEAILNAGAAAAADEAGGGTD